MFLLSSRLEIEDVAAILGPAFADCVISNCVLNLVPDKSKAFAGIFQLLKPGGRLVASDIALKKPLPDCIRDDVAAYTGCVAGAVLISEYKHLLEEAGFAAVNIVDSRADLNVYQDAEVASSAASCCGGSEAGQGRSQSCCGTSKGKRLGNTVSPGAYDVNEYAASCKIYAVKV